MMSKIEKRINNITTFFDGLQQWLKERKVVYEEKKSWNFKNIERHFRSYPANDQCIDDDTWDDLDMDEVYKVID